MKWLPGLLVLAVVQLAGVAPVAAFYDPPVIEPANPVAGQVVGFAVRVGFCDYIQASLAQAPMFAGDEWRVLQVLGNTLRVTVGTVHSADSSLCIFPTATFRFSIGQLPAGQYTLELYGRTLGAPGDVRLVGTVAFVVGAAASEARSVPALATWSRYLLVALLVILGAASVRRMPE